MNITHFWNEFQRLRPRLEPDPPEEQAGKELLTTLRGIDPRFYYHIARNTNTGDIGIIISAEGHADLMETIEQIKASAPTDHRWHIHAEYEGMLVFGERNEKVFPHTENGDILFELAQRGEPLWIERPVDFSFVFPERADAQEFCRLLRESEHLEGEISRYRGAKGFKYNVNVTVPMLPAHEQITSFENRMDQLAKIFRGRADGWGCFQVSPDPSDD